MKKRILILTALLCLLGVAVAIVACDKIVNATGNHTKDNDTSSTSGVFEIDIFSLDLLKGKWKWILEEDLNNGEFAKADEEVILKILGENKDDIADIDSCCIYFDYEIYVADTLFTTSRFRLQLCYSEISKSMNCRIDLPHYKMRSWELYFQSINDVVGKDTLVFHNFSNSYYYIRIK